MQHRPKSATEMLPPQLASTWHRQLAKLQTGCSAPDSRASSSRCSPGATAGDCTSVFLICEMGTYKRLCPEESRGQNRQEFGSNLHHCSARGRTCLRAWCRSQPRMSQATGLPRGHLFPAPLFERSACSSAVRPEAPRGQCGETGTLPGCPGAGTRGLGSCWTVRAMGSLHHGGVATSPSSPDPTFCSVQQQTPWVLKVSKGSQAFKRRYHAATQPCAHHQTPSSPWRPQIPAPWGVRPPAPLSL